MGRSWGWEKLVLGSSGWGSSGWEELGLGGAGAKAREELGLGGGSGWEELGRVELQLGELGLVLERARAGRSSGWGLG